jgi:hypothetical protein
MNDIAQQHRDALDAAHKTVADIRVGQWAAAEHTAGRFIDVPAGTGAETCLLGPLGRRPPHR